MGVYNQSLGANSFREEEILSTHFVKTGWQELAKVFVFAIADGIYYYSGEPIPESKNTKTYICWYVPSSNSYKFAYEGKLILSFTNSVWYDEVLKTDRNRNRVLTEQELNEMEVQQDRGLTLLTRMKMLALLKKHLDAATKKNKAE